MTLETRDVRRVIHKWALEMHESRLLWKYIRGEQTSAEYDALSDTLKAAVNDLTREGVIHE